MISKAFAEFFIEKHACDDRFHQDGKGRWASKAPTKLKTFVTALVKLQKGLWRR
jgi:alcohol dehydrogenase